VEIQSVNEKEDLGIEEKQMLRMQKNDRRNSQQCRARTLRDGRNTIRISTGGVPFWCWLPALMQDGTTRQFLNRVFARISARRTMATRLQLGAQLLPRLAELSGPLK
jgi:hypothetical protein